MCLVNVVLHPPLWHHVELRVVLAEIHEHPELVSSSGATPFTALLVVVCHVPAVFVLTWMHDHAVVAGIAASRSMSCIIPENVTA